MPRQIQRENGHQFIEGQPRHQVGAAGQDVVSRPERRFDGWCGFRRQFISCPSHAGVVQPLGKVSNGLTCHDDERGEEGPDESLLGEVIHFHGKRLRPPAYLSRQWHSDNRILLRRVFRSQ